MCMIVHTRSCALVMATRVPNVLRDTTTLPCHADLATATFSTHTSFNMVHRWKRTARALAKPTRYVYLHALRMTPSLTQARCVVSAGACVFSSWCVHVVFQHHQLTLPPRHFVRAVQEGVREGGQAGRAWQPLQEDQGCSLFRR